MKRIQMLSVFIGLSLQVLTWGQIDSVCKVKDGAGWGSGWVGAHVRERDEDTVYAIIVTARHCVVRNDGSHAIVTVEFPESGWVCEQCTVICYDPDDDVACVWAVIPKSIPALKLREPTWFIEVGNYGLATGTDVEWGKIALLDEHGCWTTATVVPGDSGGPLCDRAGNVVGLMTHLVQCSEDGCKSRACNAKPIMTLLEVAKEIKGSK